LVYDITSLESFRNLEFWLKELREHAEDHVVIALIGNKVDIVISDPTKREVSKEAAIEFAKRYGLIFIDESSALSNINIKNVMEKLVISITLLQPT